LRKPAGIKPLGCSGRRPEDNIKMDLRDIGWRDMDWIRRGTSGDL
jgi:hypothetical protein